MLTTSEQQRMFEVLTFQTQMPSLPVIRNPQGRSLIEGRGESKEEREKSESEATWEQELAIAPDPTNLLSINPTCRSLHKAARSCTGKDGMVG